VTSPTQLVQVRGVTRRFGTVEALSSVDLDIERGAFFSLLGPRGCGKTTLLRILAGFDQPDEGDVLLEGTSVLDVPPHRRPTNIVFQRHALFPHLTVAENVGFGLTTGGRRRRKARSRATKSAISAMLELIGMPEYGGRYPSELSGGQAQRVAVARALINRPRLLLLDEPLSALDQNERLAMRESLLNIHRDSGTTFLLVTHDQEEALSMSTAVALMNEGRIEQVGSPAALYGQPSTLFAARFIGAGSLLRGQVAKVSDGRAEVRAGLVRWSPVAVGVAGGEQALVFLRPEEMRLVGEADARVQGLVTTSVFLGASREVVVATPIGAVRLRTTHPLRAGERVSIGWADDAGRCYPSRAVI
jgi:spermidine/putrescine transport system ATP-binding protein